MGLWGRCIWSMVISFRSLWHHQGQHRRQVGEWAHLSLQDSKHRWKKVGREAWGGLLIMGIQSTRSQTQSLSRRCWKELRPKERQRLAVPWPAGGTAGGGAEGRGWTPCPVLFAISTLLLLLFVQFLLGVEKEQSKRISRGMWGQNDGRGGYTERVWGPQVSKGVGCVCVWGTASKIDFHDVIVSPKGTLGQLSIHPCCLD